MHPSGRLPASVGRALALLLTLAMISIGLTAVLRPGAQANEAQLPSPPPLLQRDENVVTSDPIPTVQIDNGYVWAQDTIGTTVYAVGDFDNAREPLAAPGTALTARSNVLAYDIDTGQLLPFAPEVNGVVKAVAASPDGSRIYIGGSFTRVNGQARWGIAALDASTGQLVPGFSPAVGGTGVYALVAQGSMVYAGGLFTQANGVARRNLAAFSAANGAVMPWAPQTNLQVDAMVADPGGDKIIAGGRFSEVNGNTAMRGAVALDGMTGEVDTGWALVQTVKNGATTGKAGIFSLNADDTAVYGTGWVYAGVTIGNLEGTFAAEADSGEVRWIADCLGDHYGVYSTGETVYTTSHTHACSTMGLHPEQNPREHRYAEAYTAEVRGTLGRNPHAGGTYQNWEGTPAPSAYAWYPDFYVGTTTGMGQAGLSITGVGDTISIAGEFQGVNQGRFEGIVRFSTNPPGGAKDGPRLTASTWQPTANSHVPGRVRVSIPANWDRDDLNLTYELRRSGSSTPVATTTVASTWWDQPTVTLEDTTAFPGASNSYSVVARDGDGNTRSSAPVTVTVAAGDPAEYVEAVLDDAPQLYYPLGSTLQDWAGANPAEAGSGVSADPQGIASSATGSSVVNGSTSGRISSGARASMGTEFSSELWFRTTTSRGGKLLGYGDASSGTSGSYDRHLYMRNDGRLVFGVYPGEVRTVQSTDRYDDGAWHHAVATLSADGQMLYVDGELVAVDPSTTTAQDYLGYWRIGGDNLSGWPNRPSSDWFSGAIDEVAIYDRALTPGQISTHYAIGSGLDAPTAAFTAIADEAQVSVDASGSSAAGTATIVEYRWDFGDGTGSVTGKTAEHTYSTTGTYIVTLTVKDSNGLLSSTTREISVLGPNLPPTADLGITVEGLGVSADGTGSTDPDGTIVSYLWDWGDGTTSTGERASHVYAAVGEYTVTLEVTDDRGGLAQASRTISTSHADPVARFTPYTTGLLVSADAGDSSASDGASLEYSWDWGDGSDPTTGAVGTHTYVEDGVYEIELTVTDSFGSTGTTVQSVTVAAEAVAASDTFTRTIGSGWGAAEEGGTWSPVGGSAAVASVADGTGALNLAAGSGRSVVLQGPSLLQSGTTFTYTLDGAPSNGALYVGSEARYSGGASYRTLVWHRADGSSWLLIQRNGTVIASLPGTPSAWEAGSSFHMRSEVVGESTPTIRMKVWPAGSGEPAAWQLETIDTSDNALTGTGSSSLYAYRAGSGTGEAPIRFDDYRLQDLSGPQPPAPNLPPTATFTVAAAGLDVEVDAAGSEDPDGSIVTYAWDFGDGATASGSTASHTYAEPGTYIITLSVTDDDGETRTTSTSQVMTEQVFVAADTFSRTESAGWGTADTGGVWSVTGGSTSAASVSDGSGILALSAGAGRSMVLNETSLRESGSSMSYTLTGPPQSGALYVGLESRFDGSSVYRSTVWHRADGTMWLLVQRRGAVIGLMPLSGRSWDSGDTFRLRTEVSGAGATTIRVKLWSEGSDEPSEWQLEVEDASGTAVTSAGAPGVYAYRAGSGNGQAPVLVDDVEVAELAEAPLGAKAAVQADPTAAMETPEALPGSPAPETGTDEVESEAEAPDEPGAEEPTMPAPESKGEAEGAAPTPEAKEDGKGQEPNTTAEEGPVPDPTEEITHGPGSVPDPATAPTSEEGSASDPIGETAPEERSVSDPASESESEPEPIPEEGDPSPTVPERSTTGDAFDRSDAPGWGETPAGAEWRIDGLATESLSIEDGSGRIDLVPGTTGRVLMDAASRGGDGLEAEFVLHGDGTAVEGTEIGVAARASEQGEYVVTAEAGHDGAVMLRVYADDEELEAIELEGVRMEIGRAYVLRVSVVGSRPTTISASLWAADSKQPEDWQLVVEDGTGPQLSEGAAGPEVSRPSGSRGDLAVSFERFEVSPSA